MNRHASAETLAAFREELLPRRKAARVSAHLAVCPRCAALDAELAQVTAMLASTAAPPMPDALTARIEAALAAEAAARSAAGQDGARGTRGRRRLGSPGPGRPRLALRVATVTAAVAVVAAGGYGVARLLSGPPSVNTGSAASGAGAPPAASGAGHSATRPVPSSGILSGPRVSTVPNSGATRIISSGTDYRRATLGAQASAVLAAEPANSGNPSASGSPAPTQAQSLSHVKTAVLTPALRGCVSRLSGSQQPLLIDLARYQGHPAVIIVLPGIGGGSPRAVVVPRTCTATTVHVLAAATLPRSG